MDLELSRLWLVTSLAIVFVGNLSASKSAPSRTIQRNGVSVKVWYCLPNEVLFSHESKHWCAKKCEDCPNGYCSRNKCVCIPGTQRDRAGVCGQICPNCENGWCSSASTCECNEGFTWSEGGCAPESGFLTGLLTAPLASPRPVLKNVQTFALSHFPGIHSYGQSVHSPHHGHHFHGSRRRGSSKNKHYFHNFFSAPMRMWNHYSHRSYNYPQSNSDSYFLTPQRPYKHFPESPSQLYPQRPQQTPSGVYPQQSPQRPVQDNPVSHSQSNPLSPPQISWRPGSQQSPQDPRPTYPGSPSQSNPQSPHATSSRFYPQQNSELPLQAPESPPQTHQQINPQTAPPPLGRELHPPQKPESPSQFPEQSPVGLQPESTLLVRPQSPLGLHPQKSSAGRPDQPYSFEEVDQQLGWSRPTGAQACQTDYLWDPVTNACIPYESAKAFEINPRAEV